VVESSRANKGLMKELGQDAYSHYTELSMMPQVLSAKTLVRAQGAERQPGDLQRARPARAAVRQRRADGGDVHGTSMLLAGQALNITVCSFGDKLDMGILACPDLCPSPQRIAVYAGEEVAMLEEAMGLKPSRTPRRARRERPGPQGPPARRRRGGQEGGTEEGGTEEGPCSEEGCTGKGAQGRRDDREDDARPPKKARARLGESAKPAAARPALSDGCRSRRAP
jgi:hypothetical protein